MCFPYQEASKNVSERFVNEDLGLHWRVDDSSESFQRLLNHIEKGTNFRSYFEQALDSCEFPQIPGGALIADVGAGVGWTSAIIGLRLGVAKVFAIEPSRNRLDRINRVARHFNVPRGKVVPIHGYFQDFNLKEKVNAVVLCASLHHCYNKDLSMLFRNIRQILLPYPEGGTVLIANEHYVNLSWTLVRMVSWARRLCRGESTYYGPGQWRAPHPFDGEHWRKKRELEAIFAKEGFNARFVIHDGNLSKNKSNWWARAGFIYYHAILSQNDE